MCTLTVALSVHPEFPVLLAANRDERLDRPSTPPQVWPGEVPFLAGRDEEAQGTWLGVNGRGLIVGLTNHWSGRPADPQRRSRGEVVADLLGAEDLPGVQARLRERDPEATNPFLLLAADAGGGGFWTSSAQGLELNPLQAGIFSLGNRIPDPGDDRPSAARRAMRAALDPVPGSVEDLRNALASALATHAGNRGPLVSPCVHTDQNFGTVSATIVALGNEESSRWIWHAPGPPCQHSFEEYSEAWRALS